MMTPPVDSTTPKGVDCPKGEKCPTTEVYEALQLAYEHFNRELFAGELPPCLITLQRSKRCRAYYSPDRFARGDRRRGNVEYTDEIAMNPLYFGTRSPLETLSTLVHEMTHHWQRRLGTPTRRAYHDRQWSAKMVEVGLQPSHTGLPGGKAQGQKMSHFIITDGPFHRAATALLESSWVLEWYDRFPSEEAVKSSLATRYSPTPPPEPDVIDDPEGAGPVEPANPMAAEPANQAPAAPKQTMKAWPAEPAIEPRKPVYDSSHRLKYACDGCGAKVWGKAGLRLSCIACNRELTPAQKPTPETKH